MLDKALEATRSGLQETRRALKSLRASPLDDLGLGMALHRLAVDAAHRAQLRLDVDIPASLPTLSPDVEQCIYRVAQEAVTNVTHHANAQTLQLHLTCQNGEIDLRVRDDGQGFTAQTGEQPNHFGLSGIRERAQLAGGVITIDSRAGHGTTVQLSIKDVD
jgi:signal transduction histidine kinase